MKKAYPKVTIVGAGNVGATTALQILSKNLANVVLIDVADGVAKGKALDLMHMRSNEHFGPTVMGTGDYKDTAKSDIVVVTAGVPRKPGMTREDLVGINAGIVRSVLEGALPKSPNAIYIFVTNPLDVMTNLAASIAQLPKGRLLGMGGVLDTARFTYAIAEATGAEPSEVNAMVIGAHGEAMVPLPSLATVKGRPLMEVLAEDGANVQEKLATIMDATVQGGAAVVKLLETGSAFYAPGSSIARMVEAILNDTGEVFSVCSPLSGEYGIDGVLMCVPTVLGAEGMREIVELPLSSEELTQLQDSAVAIKDMLKDLITV